jgi:thiamine-phosphate pyrophosphorylase
MSTPPPPVAGRRDAEGDGEVLRRAFSSTIRRGANDLSRSALERYLAVYLVADPGQTTRDLVADVEAALAGGVTCVQLRAKRVTDRESLDLARAVADCCREAGALFIVNDRLDIALAAGAGGVHLGVDDLPVRDARRLAGSAFIIGYSPETDQQTTAARAEGADYLGVGPVFSTRSKNDAGDAIGLETIRRRAALAGIPIVGIGGVTVATAAAVIEAGAIGVAVVGAILRSDDPHLAAQALSTAVLNAKSGAHAG